MIIKEILISEKNELEKKKRDISVSLDKVKAKEREIEEKEAGIDPQKDKKNTEEDLWVWRKKRRAIEEERWGWDDKLLKISNEIEEITKRYEKIEEASFKNSSSLENIYSKLEKIRLDKERDALEIELNNILLSKSSIQKNLDKIIARNRDVNEELYSITRDGEILTEERRNIEAKESSEKDPIRLREIEKERWLVEDKIRENEEKRKPKEIVIKSLEKELEKEKNRYQKIENKEALIRKKIEKITLADIPTQSNNKEKSLSEMEKNENYDIIKEYIYKNSDSPEEDIERIKIDNNFLNYILDQIESD